jgi:hypothetical protein
MKIIKGMNGIIGMGWDTGLMKYPIPPETLLSSEYIYKGTRINLEYKTKNISYFYPVFS